MGKKNKKVAEKNPTDSTCEILKLHKPVTRRDFLSQGYISAGSLLVMPSLISLLATKRAFAAECPTASLTGGKIPTLVMDLAGGASIAGSNVMVGGAGGQLDFLNSYTRLGLPSDMHPRNAGQINSDLGLVFHADSAFLRGIMSTTSASTRAAMDGLVFCTSSGNDTGNNPHNPMYYLQKAGVSGNLVDLIGTRNSVSGGRSVSPMASVDPTKRPTKISSANDAAGLVGMGRLSELLNNPEKVEAVTRAIASISSSQLTAFSQKDLPNQIKTLVDCGYVKFTENVARYNPTALDPSNDPIVAGTFNLGNGTQARSAAVAKLVVDGMAGSGTIEIGGCDYHNGTRATGEARDEEIGRNIGSAMEMAAQKGSPLVVYTFSDGSVYSRGTLDNSAGGRGKGIWNGDNSSGAAAFMLVYNPNGRAGIRDGASRQIGNFTPSEGADKNSVIGNSVENLVKAVIANYLALHGEEGRLAEVVGDNPFGANLDKYIAFKKIV